MSKRRFSRCDKYSANHHKILSLNILMQIARGLVLPLTIAVSSIHTRTSPSRKVLMAAAIVTIGFMLGVAPSSYVSLPASSIPSPLSLFYGVLSSLFIALHAVLIKKSLPYCNNSTIELAWWTNAGSAAMVFPFVLLNGELSTLRVLSQSNEWNWRVFLWGTTVTGLFGFLLCVAGLLSIKVTSPITHMFSSVRNSDPSRHFLFVLTDYDGNSADFVGGAYCLADSVGRLDIR